MNQILSIARFELRYHLRRPVTYLFGSLLLLMAFMVITTDAVRVGGVGGNVFANGPWAVNLSILAFTIVGTAVTSAIAGTAILRDFEFKSHELLFTTRMSKASFVLGRYLGACAVTILVLSCSALGLWLGSGMPWVDPAKLTTPPPGTYLVPLLIYVVPAGIFISALFFAVGVLTRSFVAVYVQGVVLFVGYSLALSLVSDLDNETLAAMLDPFGLIATQQIDRDWATAQKNTLTMPLTGVLLYNRLLWTGLGLAILGGAYGRFRMQAQLEGRRRAPAPDPEPAPAHAPPPTVASAAPGAASRRAQFAAMTSLHLRSILRERAFLAIVSVGMLITVVEAFHADMMYGTATYPVTYVMVEIVGAFNLFFLILTALYSGELVWRERALRCDQIVDATPTSTTLAFLSKITALVVVFALLYAALIAAAVAVQALKGYFLFEPGVYFGYLYGLSFPGLVLVVLLAFALHVLADQKFVGTMLVLLYYMLTLVLAVWGAQHNLYVYAGFPAPKYSAMNGYGPNLGPFAWFHAYYFAFAAALLVLIQPLLVRGKHDGWRARLAAARRRLTPRWAAALAAAALVWLGLGGWIYYNTNVLRTYRDSDDNDALQAAYERAYKQYEGLPQPKIAAVDVTVDLYPERGQMAARGSYRIENRTDAAIERVHVRLSDEITVRELGFDRESTLEHEDRALGYRIYRLEAPLAPGASARLEFDLAHDRPGFGNTGYPLAIVENGSFLQSSDYLPGLGYTALAELEDDDRRRDQGLPPRERTPALEDEAARANTYVGTDADWIDFQATVCTAPDQIALAPGYLQREWTEGDRRCFAYAMDAKILNFYAFLSARYEVRRDRWKDVDIEIYYHPGHEYNLDRMIDATKKSLDYFTTNFSPYQHRQVRILEFPRYASFAQAFPNTIPYSESIGFIARVRPEDPEDLDYPFYVTAHEVAHQWWAHQVIGANVQGATMLSESLAQYSSLMVMEKEYGRDKMKKFLAYELRTYLNGRSDERKKELPLMRVEGQGYIRYQKGSLVFYALRDYIGEDALNAVLARYIRKVAFQRPPFTTSRELVDMLREATPPEYRYVIEDLFETITLHDHRIASASKEALADGKTRVRFTIASRKLRADGQGVETEVPVADHVDVGVFAAPGPGELELGAPLYFERRALTGPETVVEVVVEGDPARVGVDPYNKLIDRLPKDNTAPI